MGHTHACKKCGQIVVHSSDDRCSHCDTEIFCYAHDPANAEEVKARNAAAPRK